MIDLNETIRSHYQIFLSQGVSKETAVEELAMLYTATAVRNALRVVKA